MKDYSLLNDDELLSKLKVSADQAIFLEIYERYHAALYTMAARRCHSPEAAEELVQDLFVKLWNKRQEIALYSTLRNYLFTAIKNAVLNHLHYEALRKNIRVSCELPDIYADNSMEELMLANDLSRLINRQIKTLPERCRIVFERSRLMHKTNKQIASELGITEKTVENQISRAIKFLRIGLQQLLILVIVFTNGV